MKPALSEVERATSRRSGVASAVSAETFFVRAQLLVQSFWLRRREDFLKTRIIAERVEHWIEPKQRKSERHARSQCALGRYRQQFLQRGDGPIRLSQLCCYSGGDLDRSGTIYYVFLNRKHGHRLLRQSQRGGFVT